MILLDLKGAQPRADGNPAQRVSIAGPAAAAKVRKAPQGACNSTILRFHRSERMLHWAITIPFLACFATALVLLVVYSPAPHRPLRSVVSWIHRSLGIALAVLPVLALLQGRRELSVHWQNVKEAWMWGRDDFRWLALMPLAVLSSKIKLPEQGKFNAAEKLNFMVLMATYPLYLVTGLLIWLKTYAVMAWVLHVLMAAIATPLIFGHMYMAMIDSGGRPGLQGMFSGFVGREWAKHHYPRWYREHYELEEAPAPEEENLEAARPGTASVPGRE